jgi:hypothetical protein|tara:strand:+ start:55 stop:474 length:420 start_codon:yes stop_codon:yes gene_type:complete
MTFADERKAIESRLSTNWTTTTIQFENVPFKKPDNNTYIAMFILNGSAEQIDMSGSATTDKHRHIGNIIIQIFVPADTGTNTARSYADSLATIFRAVQFSAGSSGTILCRTPTITRVGVSEGILQTNLDIPFQRDVTYS